MAEIRSYESRVAGLLTQPSGCRVAQRVCGDALVDSGTRGCATHDQAEDGRL